MIEKGGAHGCETWALTLLDLARDGVGGLDNGRNQTHLPQMGSSYSLGMLSSNCSSPRSRSPRLEPSLVHGLPIFY